MLQTKIQPMRRQKASSFQNPVPYPIPPPLHFTSSHLITNENSLRQTQGLGLLGQQQVIWSNIFHLLQQWSIYIYFTFRLNPYNRSMDEAFKNLSISSSSVLNALASITPGSLQLLSVATYNCWSVHREVSDFSTTPSPSPSGAGQLATSINWHCRLTKRKKKKSGVQTLLTNLL